MELIWLIYTYIKIRLLINIRYLSNKYVERLKKAGHHQVAPPLILNLEN